MRFSLRGFSIGFLMIVGCFIIAGLIIVFIDGSFTLLTEDLIFTKLLFSMSLVGGIIGALVFPYLKENGDETK